MFINSKSCFTVGYLKLFASLNFRGYLSNTAAVWALMKAFPSPEYLSVDRQRKMHQGAVLYYTAVNEFTCLNMHKEILMPHQKDTGPNFSPATIDRYENDCHENAYPPAVRSKVEILVGDGHVKVQAKCGSMGSDKKRGRPKGNKSKRKKLKKSKNTNRSNGWFMICDPGSSRIVAVEQQILPERNAIVTAALTKATRTCKNAHTFVYDRNCGYAPKESKNPELKNITNYPVEPRHGNRHKKNASIASRTTAGSKNY